MRFCRGDVLFKTCMVVVLLHNGVLAFCCETAIVVPSEFIFWHFNCLTT